MKRTISGAKKHIKRNWSLISFVLNSAPPASLLSRQDVHVSAALGDSRPMIKRTHAGRRQVSLSFPLHTIYLLTDGDVYAVEGVRRAELGCLVWMFDVRQST